MSDAALPDDLLGSAAAALRDLTAAPTSGGDPEHTRRRVMASLGERRQTHRRRVTFAVLAFALSTATLSWAASTGRLTTVLKQLHIVDAGPSPADPRTPRRRGTPSVAAVPAEPATDAVAPASPPPAEPASARPAASAVIAPVAPAALAPDARAPHSAASSAPDAVARTRAAVRSIPGSTAANDRRARIATAPAAAPVAAPSTEPPATVEDRDTASYRRAHALHFRGGDASATLAAWDAYLAAFPRGRFATEAAYNRAITLVRLDRKAEARAALAPFAAGTVDDGYRRDEAKALREALDRE